MKTFKIDASKIDLGENIKNDFSGIIELEVPNVRERMEIAKTMSIADIKDDDLNAASDLFEMVEKHVKKVDVVHKKSKTHIKDVQELSYYKEGFKLLMGFTKYLMEGVPLGNA